MKMAMCRFGMVILGLFLLPSYAGATDVAAPVSNQSTSYAPHSAPARSVRAPQPNADTGIKRAVFAREQASGDAYEIANWVVDSGDNAGLPFVIIDKTDAKIFVFDAAGRIRGASPVLLGLARGDDTVPGIGDRELSDIRPEERTTPAGRFVAGRGMSTRGVDVVWVDYEAGVSLHRVITANPRDRRLERLATPTPADNRISYGCINVPVAFYNEVVNPSFNGTNGIVYVLPETRPIRQVFGSYNIEERHQTAVRAPVISIIAGVAPANR
jgi:hypothetical protein